MQNASQLSRITHIHFPEQINGMEYIPYAVLVFGLFLYMLFSCRYQLPVFIAGSASGLLDSVLDRETSLCLPTYLFKASHGNKYIESFTVSLGIFN